MELFKKKQTKPEFFEEEVLDDKFDVMMSWIKYLSRKDYNKIKKAMDLDYNAYQTLHGIEIDEETSIEDSEFILSKEEK